jgi:hypothetical protein
MATLDLLWQLKVDDGSDSRVRTWTLSDKLVAVGVEHTISLVPSYTGTAGYEITQDGTSVTSHKYLWVSTDKRVTVKMGTTNAANKGFVVPADGCVMAAVTNQTKVYLINSAAHTATVSTCVFVAP